MRVLAAPLMALAVCCPSAFSAAQPAIAMEAMVTNAGTTPIAAT